MKQIILLITAITLLGSTLRAQETTAADLMAKGLYEENINGDFKKAEVYYQEILDEYSGEKKIAALATFHLAKCLEESGKIDQSIKIYENLIERYPEEKQLVSQAQRKITNSGGIHYFTDHRDGKTYKYVNIGSQTWMAENLAYIPHVGPTEVNSGIWVLMYFGNDPKEAIQEENYRKYGCLYDYETARKSCPSGWHLSSEEDWIRLEKYLGYYDKIIDHPGKITLNDNSINTFVMSQGIENSTYLSNHTGLSLVRGGFWMGRENLTGRFSGLPVQNGFYWAEPQDIGALPVTCFFYEKLGHRRSASRVPSIIRGQSVRCVKDIPAVLAKAPQKTKIYHPNDSSDVQGYTHILVTTAKNELTDSVSLYFKKGNELTHLAVDYSSLNKTGTNLPVQSLQYWLGWDTRQFPDGWHEIVAVSYFYGGYRDTASIKVQIVNQNDFANHGEFTDIRDGKTYRYINIGNQKWMAQNLSIELDDGSGSFCYKNLTAHCETYGRLYTFETARKACPEGWRLPSSKEWQEMEVFLGFDTALLEDERFYMEDSTGQKLKAEFDWINRYNISNKTWEKASGTNLSGFNALPAGVLNRDGQFKDLYKETDFWTSSIDPNHGPEVRQLYFHLDCIGRDNGGKDNYALSVRCIKDN